MAVWLISLRPTFTTNPSLASRQVLHGITDRHSRGKVADLKADFPPQSLLQTERELERTKDPNVDYYAPGHLAVLVKTLSVSLTVSLLLIPVFVLFLVPMSKEAMAWMVFGFVVAFSITISIMTEARAQELLIGSAALVLPLFSENVLCC